MVPELLHKKVDWVSQEEQVSKQLSSMAFWRQFLPWVSPFPLWWELCTEINPFLTKFLLQLCFVTAMETLTKTLYFLDTVGQVYRNSQLLWQHAQGLHILQPDKIPGWRRKGAWSAMPSWGANGIWLLLREEKSVSLSDKILGILTILQSGAMPRKSWPKQTGLNGFKKKRVRKRTWSWMFQEVEEDLRGVGNWKWTWTLIKC